MQPNVLLSLQTCLLFGREAFPVKHQDRRDAGVHQVAQTREEGVADARGNLDRQWDHKVVVRRPRLRWQVRQYVLEVTLVCLTGAT
jgi:hypothetical protein